MIRSDVEIQTGDGPAEAAVYRPEGERQFPGVLHLTDIFGIRPTYHAMAERLAGEGYVVLMPNIFYRAARPPVLDRKSMHGEADFRKKFEELTGSLTPDAIESDAAAYVDALTRERGVANGSRLGVVGFCYSGGFALRVAAARPAQIAAAASFHGGHLVTDAPSSPHLLLPRIHARLYFGYAVEDNSMPEEAIRKLDAALAQWGGRYESETYAGAHHGWTASDNPAFNAPQAERAFKKLTELFGAALR